MGEPEFFQTGHADLDRLIYRATNTELTPIPWPPDLDPTPVNYNATPDTALPAADVLVVTFTEAEGQALSAVLSPGHPSSDWLRYAKNWDSFKSQLTWRSPARASNCLGAYALIEIGSTRVVLFKSALHPDTDGPTIPLRQLWRQMIEDTGCKLAVTSGTAGGVGAETVLGDVLVASNVRWDCEKQFKDAAFAGQSFKCTATITSNATTIAESLMAVNAERLKPIATRNPIVIPAGDCVSTDFFAWDDVENTFGLRTFDPADHMVEMDDGALGLAIGDLGKKAPAWVSIRNASDPQMPKGASLEAEDKAAATIYQHYGFFTTVGSAIVCWAIIASL
jgi:nucleoside phosphorylase